MDVWKNINSAPMSPENDERGNYEIPMVSKQKTGHFDSSQEVELIRSGFHQNEDTSQDSIDGLDQGHVRIAPLQTRNLEGGKKDDSLKDESRDTIS